MLNNRRTMSTCTGNGTKDDLENNPELRTGDGIHVGGVESKGGVHS